MSQSRPNKPTTRQLDKGWAKLGLSCLSAAAAETATYPVDAIKTQLQLQLTTKPAGAVQLARQVLSSHGLSGLYAGLSPAVLRHFFYTGTRITLYEQLKTAYASHQAAATTTSSTSSSSTASAAAQGPSTTPLWAGLLFGLTAGAVGQLVAVPADLIKVQMQADVRAVMSGQRQHRQFNGISSVAKLLVRQHGIAGLWRGGLPAVQRAALVNLGELSTYDSAKQGITRAALLPQGLPTHLAASLCSGFVSALISTPADVVKTRLMAQATVSFPGRPTPPVTAAAKRTYSSRSTSCSSTYSSYRSIASRAAAPICWSSSTSVRCCHGNSSAGPYYTGMVDCAVQTARQEGFMALYKGFVPTWARLGPWQLVFWVTYEQFRSLASISAF